MLEKIEALMLKNGIDNRMVLSQKIGIPYTTLDSMFKKNCDNVGRKTLLKLAHFFNCSIDYLADDDYKEAIADDGIMANTEDALLLLRRLALAFGRENNGESLEEAEQKLIILLDIVRGRKALL